MRIFLGVLSRGEGWPVLAKKFDDYWEGVGSCRIPHACELFNPLLFILKFDGWVMYYRSEEEPWHIHMQHT